MVFKNAGKVQAVRRIRVHCAADVKIRKIAHPVLAELAMQMDMIIIRQVSRVHFAPEEAAGYDLNPFHTPMVVLENRIALPRIYRIEKKG